MHRECGSDYTECRSLRKGSYLRPVAFGPDDARKSSATGSSRNHPGMRAMSFRGLPAAVCLFTPRGWSARRSLRAGGLAVAAVCVLTACSHAAEPASVPTSSSSVLPTPGPGVTTPTAPASTLPTGPPPAASVLVAPAPSGPVTAGQLGSPQAAASTWLSRWCGYDYRDRLGTRENRAHPVMTERAWLNFDPLTTPASAKAWAAIVAGRRSAGCSAPVAVISPEAPRSQTGAYVIVTANRVVTLEGGAPVVEQVRETRQVLFREGRWLVDIAANGAG